MITISKENLKKAIADCAEKSFNDGANHAIKAVTHGLKILKEDLGIESLTVDEVIDLINNVKE